MLDCNKFIELLSDLLDNTVEEPLYTSLLTHLNSCPHCRAIFEAHKKIADRLILHGQVDPPETLRGKIMEKVLHSSSQSTDNPHTIGSQRIIAGLILVTLIGGAGFFAFKTSHKTHTPILLKIEVPTTASESSSISAGVASHTSAASQSVLIDRKPE